MEFLRCTDTHGVFESRLILSSQDLREAAEAATTSSGQAASEAQHERVAIDVEETAGSWVGGPHSIPSGLVLRRLPPGEALPLCAEER